MASPATAKGVVPKVGVSTASTPIKSPELKKPKVHGRSARVEAFVENYASGSTSPVGQMLDLTDDVLEREEPDPRKLDDVFQAADTELDVSRLSAYICAI